MKGHEGKEMKKSPISKLASQIKEKLDYIMIDNHKI